MALVSYNKKQKPQYDMNWVRDYNDDSTSTALENKLHKYTSGYLYTPWEQKNETILEHRITEIVKDYSQVASAIKDITWDINYDYTLDATASNELYVTVPDYGETITATGSANILITYGDAAANTAGTYATNLFIDSRPLTKEERFRQQLRQKLTPQILFRRFGVGRTSKDSEKRAREALRAIIGEQRFLRYLKHGFITVKGQSGLVYQVFPGHEMTRVWKDGKPFERLCVVFCDSSVPPSDSVIMRLLMILDSEEEFRKQANKFNFTINDAKQPLPSRIAA